MNLHTDDTCIYQFYEPRGFQRAEEQDIVMEMSMGKIPLKCLYSKVVPKEAKLVLCFCGLIVMADCIN